jgi:hypothetical protein
MTSSLRAMEIEIALAVVTRLSFDKKKGIG